MSNSFIDKIEFLHLLAGTGCFIRNVDERSLSNVKQSMNCTGTIKIVLPLFCAETFASYAPLTLIFANYVQTTDRPCDLT